MRKSLPNKTSCINADQEQLEQPFKANGYTLTFDQKYSALRVSSNNDSPGKTNPPHEHTMVQIHIRQMRHLFPLAFIKWHQNSKFFTRQPEPPN